MLYEEEVNTGSSYLLTEDLPTNPRALDHGGDRSDAGRRAGRHDAGTASAMPWRPLEPYMLEESAGAAGEYAARCLASDSIESLFDLVIANAELRAGRAVVHDVLTALAGASDGASIASLAAGDPDREVSVAHVLSLLGNHVLRTATRFSLTPVLRSAVGRRYPLGRPVTVVTHRHVVAVGEAYGHEAQRLWREPS
jgi:hypothetical protein